MTEIVVVVSHIEEFNSVLAKYFFENKCFLDDYRSLCDELEKLEDFLYPTVHIAEESGAASNVCEAIFRMGSDVCNAIFHAHRMGRKIKKLNERITKIQIRWLCPPCRCSSVNSPDEPNSKERCECSSVNEPVEDSKERWDGIDAHQLKRVYETLPDVLKLCVVYFSVFPKNIVIECEKLLHIWIAQGLVSGHVYNLARLYIDELIDRRLIIQVGGVGRAECCKFHNLLHDLAVSEFVKQTVCLLKPGEQLETLPVNCQQDLRIISLIKNDICAINQAIQCPGLRILLLSENLRLTSITASFFNNLTYLTVLDLSYTAIASLPKSIGKLKHLKFLNLSRTNISELPEYLSGLGRLQFLDVSHCFNLSNLHSGIGKNRLMLYLNVESCDKLEWLPVGLSKLGHLQTLKGTLSLARADADAKALRVRDLRGLTLLRHLELSLENGLSSEDIIQLERGTIQLKDGTFGEMKKMQTLSFKNNSPHFLALPNDMGVMERLQVVCLGKCVVPEWIFGLENLMELELEDDNSVGNVYKGLALIPNLKKLHLSYNHKCTEFPEEFGKCKAFPKLEELIIDHFDCLKKFPSLQDTAMPMLKYFRLRWCKALKNIAEGLENLRSLEEVELSKGDLDLSEGPWLDILKARQIKIKVLQDDYNVRDIASD